MAEILGIGLTHYPPLIGEDEKMSGILRRMLMNPELPHALRDSGGWPEGMQAEWGDDMGAAAAERHREELVAWLRKTRRAIDDFQPDYILMWGDDQYENFKEDVIPSYCVNAHPRFEFHIPPNNIWGESPDQIFSVEGVPKEGKEIAIRLIEQGFDTAYSYKALHLGLGHAFSNAIFYLDYDRQGWPYPILPVSVNCYGRYVICQQGGLPRFDEALRDEDLDPPAPQPWRLFDLGVATARALKDMPGRVCVMASSGWSHAFLTKKNHFLFPDRDADRTLYEAMQRANFNVWRNYPAAQIEESGQQEVLNWMPLLGAMKELGRTSFDTAFVDTWIFNSSKSFLISQPDQESVETVSAIG